MKRYWLPVLLAVLLALLCGPASAVDMDYVGEVDRFTGLPSGEVSTGTGGRITVSDGVRYDADSGMFLLDTGGYGTLTSSVVDGMAVTGTVDIQIEGEFTPVLYRDGVLVEDADLGYLTEQGQYVLTLGQTGDPGAYTLQFTILGEVSGLLNSYRLPDGFEMSSASLNGEPTDWTASYVDLEREGDYEISYRCQATGVSYGLNFTADHTPPVLALEAVTEGRADGPVDLSDAEEGAVLSATLDGTTISPKGQLTQSGAYVLTITDTAGNSTTYQFEIMVYFNNNSFAFFALALLAILVLAGYLIWSRRHLRVR